jgi:hypothetical protein
MKKGYQTGQMLSRKTEGYASLLSVRHGIIPVPSLFIFRFFRKLENR